MAANYTTPTGLPPLPSYNETLMPDLLSWFPDFWMNIILPIVAYWVTSIFFHIIDEFDLLPQYRLHTPAEIAQRNRATRFEVLRDVLLQQVIQFIVAYWLNLSEPPQMTGKDDYNVAVWAQRVRLAQRTLPTLLGFMGLNAANISKNISGSRPLLAGALAGGHYPFLTSSLLGSDGVAVPTFATWELLVAKAIYWALIPAAQYVVAIWVVDTWQYFLHRGMHMNKFLYVWLHSRHHRLYVPYAYGALYNHPIEGFLLDTLGAGLAYKVAFMTPRQGTLFFCLSTIKTVDDHCGYALPWDPIQHITGNNAAYHDIHHQSWGIKTNFSQPFFTVWDRFFNTMYRGDATLKYERAKQSAQASLEAEAKKKSAKAQ